jgi:hypothetical protein
VLSRYQFSLFDRPLRRHWLKLGEVQQNLIFALFYDALYEPLLLLQEAKGSQKQQNYIVA